MSTNLTYMEAAILVLRESNHPLSAKEIFIEIQFRDLVENIQKIPFNSVKRIIQRHITRYGEHSLIEIVDQSRYRLRVGVTDNLSSPHLRKILGRSPIETPEKVWVFEASLLENIDNHHGIDKNYQKYMTAIFDKGKFEFRNRLDVETDSNYKQLVSYVIVRYQNKLLRFTRNDGNIRSDHSDLDGKYSIGFGGHVQEIDHDMFSNYAVYENSVRRELKEEINFRLLESTGKLETVGVLRDETTTSGRCHLAFIHLLDLKKPSFRGGEEVIQELKLVDFQEISKEFGNYEYWSKLCLETFFPESLSNTTYICPTEEFVLRNRNVYLSVVGNIGSGKSEAAKILENEFGYQRIPVSTILRDLIGCPPMEEIGRSQMQDLGHAFITTPGNHEKFAQAIFDYIKRHVGTKYVIDGLRYPETQAFLEAILHEHLTTIYVQNSVDRRYDFFQARQNEKATFSKFLEISSHPVERQVPYFFPEAEIVIYNHGSNGSFVSALRRFFRSELTDDFLTESWDINASKRHEQLTKHIDLTFWDVIVPNIVAVLKSCQKHDTFSVLDVGCGTGVLSLILAEYVNKLFGIDSSFESIKIAKEYCKKATNTSFQCIAIEDYQKSELYDFVVANMTLQAEKSLDQSLESIYRNLKANGLFVCTIPHPIFYPIRKKQLFPRQSYEYYKHSFYKIAFTIWNDIQPLPSLIPYFHRTLGYYFAALRKAGFVIEQQLEPNPQDNDMPQYLKDQWKYPHILMFVCSKVPSLSH